MFSWAQGDLPSSNWPCAKVLCWNGATSLCMSPKVQMRKALTFVFFTTLSSETTLVTYFFPGKSLCELQQSCQMELPLPGLFCCSKIQEWVWILPETWQATPGTFKDCMDRPVSETVGVKTFLWEAWLAQPTRLNKILTMLQLLLV